MRQEKLSKIIDDLSCGGKYCKFYEMLMDELDSVSDDRIFTMRETIRFVYPEHSIKIDAYDKMRVLYEYSLLP